MNKRMRAILAVTAVGLVGGATLAAKSAQAAATGNELSPLGEPVAEVETLGLGSLSGFYLAARHAGFNNDLDAAAGFYASALLKDPDNAELLDRSVLLSVASGNIRRAAELAEELLATDPTDQVALIALSIAQLRGGEVAEAIATVEKLGDLGGQLQPLVAGLVRAWAMTADGRAEEAIAFLDDLSGQPWYEDFTTLHAGLIADHAELWERAEDRLSRAYERDPGVVRVVDAYARFLVRSGDEARALGVLRAFEDRLGGNTLFTQPLRDEIASGAVRPQIVAPRQGVAEALYGIGSALGQDAGDTFAASLLQLALYLHPDAYYPAMALGQVMEAMGQHEDAIAVYRGVPDEAPLKRNAQVQVALNLNILERHDEAIALLEDLVAADPQDVSTAVALGNVLRSRERFSEAADIYTRTIGAFDEVPAAYWTLYYYRGIAYERTNQWQKAEQDLRRALELEPEQPLVLNYLGYSLIDRGEKLDEALDMVRRAVQQRPDDGYIVDSLGWAYYRLGRFEDAVEELERAVQLKPADPVINDHLGDAYWRVGRKLEAMFQWAHARDNDPEPEELAKIQRKLREGLPGEDGATQEAAAGAGDAAEQEPAAAQE